MRSTVRSFSSQVSGYVTYFHFDYEILALLVLAPEAESPQLNAFIDTPDILCFR